MLVLSRKLNEKIVIDGGIVVTVVKIDRNQVRLGIEAPGDVSVYREELLSQANSFEMSEDKRYAEIEVPIGAAAATDA